MLDHPQEQQYGLCHSCQLELFRIQDPVCATCGMPLISEQNLCTTCRKQPASAIRQRACFFYYGTIAQLLREYKNTGDWGLAAFFADAIFHCYLQYFSHQTVIPIVSNPRARRHRGFDPVQRISYCLFHRYHLPLRHCFKRFPGKSQKLLSAAEREHNLRGRFRLRKGICSLPSEVLLLDDIRTTGNTASECRRVLMDHGVQLCHLLTITLPFPT